MINVQSQLRCSTKVFSSFSITFSERGVNSPRHEYFVNAYADLAKKMSGKDTLDTLLLFAIRLYCYGAVGMTREWVLTDNITSAETLAGMMFDSMPEALKKIYFGK